MLFLLLGCTKEAVKSKSSISFGPELPVTISGLTTAAMEPFISPDGNTLFFNNLNDGINTQLFYATRVDEQHFVFVGALSGANQPASPRLDAVADLDGQGNFYWTSTRDYPAELDNLFRGDFSAGVLSNLERVHGNFNKNTPGWLVMDHGISADGQFLYFNNARFDDAHCIGPCETEIGLAQKVNATTFNRVANSEVLLAQVNQTQYINYAPCISADQRELYFTRYLKGSLPSVPLFEVCVALRGSTQEAFAAPKVLFSDAQFIEAPSLTADGQVMYYHKKVGDVYRIMMRKRQ
ncbi:PD40 domain-containing protein [Flavobacterium sp. CYK-55]|uniref:PD40 domain-containing protein n=1 Tax=Flavobacterium sp. CYK-55 TaxID=2835529 RepID=UPI001BCD9193|nr:PD40 domain-containing protein [Flavobacterium sp. CYK-55]MBS7787108.1 PD40 domain-containing protein [Flavobacterium sp. CYK-55]